MFDFARKLIRALHIPSSDELEAAYLAGAANRYDLENREREIAAGRFRSAGQRYY